MQPIYKPLEEKLPKGLFMLPAVMGNSQQAYGIEEEQTAHIAPGEINMGEPIPLFIEECQGNQGDQEKLPGKP